LNKNPANLRCKIAREAATLLYLGMEKEYKQAEKVLLKKWERQGISGSAVQPKIQGSPEWQEAVGKFKQPFDDQLQVLKKELQG
jgi:hypothetical protein